MVKQSPYSSIPRSIVIPEKKDVVARFIGPSCKPDKSGNYSVIAIHLKSESLLWDYYRSLFLVFLILGCEFLFAPATEASSGNIDYYSSENILAFAEHLYQEGDYLRAAGEYQRYLFYFPLEKDASSTHLPPLKASSSHSPFLKGGRGDLEGQERSNTLYKIGFCYRLAGDIDRAIAFFRKAMLESTEGPSHFAASYQIAYSYFLSDQYENSIQHLNQALDKTKNANERGQLQILAAFNYLHQRRWSHVERVLGAQALKDEKLNRTASDLRMKAQEGIDLPRKNPILAGLFSAVVPGAGKVYCRQYGDGIYSFVLVGATGLLAWRGFRENGVHSVRGWLFGSIGAIFYAGNVYGSNIAARIYNRQLEAELLKRLPAIPDQEFSPL